MATRWPGARKELGLEIGWRIAFVKPGTVAVPSVDAVYLDVGGDLCPGVIDHHQGTPRASSAARLLFERPELVMEHLVAPWQRALLGARLEGGADRTVRPTIVLHSAPDFDALVTSHLAMKLVEDGGFPVYAKALVEYADSVDQGFERFDYKNPQTLLYPMILVLSNLAPADALRLHEASFTDPVPDVDSARFQLGQLLIGLWVSASKTPTNTTVLVQPVAGDSAGPFSPSETKLVEELYRHLVKDVEAFERLKREDGIKFIGEVEVPMGEGSTTKLPGSAIPDYHALALNKFYLRTEGVHGIPTPITVIHGWTWGASARPGRARFIISLDPTCKVKGGQLNLRGLAAALEWQEAQVRRGIDDARDERSGVSRYEEFPGNSDPWYDGRGHDYTIVDSPICGTCMSFEQVIAVLRTPFWDPIVCEAVIMSFDGEGVPSFETIGFTRMGEIQSKLAMLRARGDGERRFQVVVADLSPMWGPRASADFARFVTGGSYEVLSSDYGICHIGASGVLIDSRTPCGVATELSGHFGRIVKFAASLSRIDVRLSGADSVPTSRECRGLLRSHTKAVASFYSTRATDQRADAIEISLLVERKLDLQARAEGVGRLLEYLNEERERADESSLNRLVLIIGMFGFIQAVAALVDLPGQWMEGGRWSEWRSLQVSVWALALGFSMILVVIALCTLSRRATALIQRLAHFLPLPNRVRSIVEDLD